ncbi:MAG: DNA-binding response regulator [Spirochaetaceae bacterium]|nr:MAG: DNA-binding response regulator [Spirochaetaceae bacterium]
MKSVKVLLADDHAVVRAGLRDALVNIPSLKIVGEVGNGGQLMDALSSLRPDLLLMDVNMPGFDPVQAAIKIKETYPDMKILVVTAYDDQAYVVGLLAAGVDGYHLKDQPLADLQLAVQQILKGERWISGSLVNRLVDQKTSAADMGMPLLTKRQRELLRLLTLGYDNKTIASEMVLSIKTVENHLTSLYRVLGVESRLEACNYAMCHPETLGVAAHAVWGSRVENHVPHSLSILLVDDNSRYRNQLGKMIGKSCPQASLFEAGDTEEVLRLARQIKPQLAFIDVVLPGDDGIHCVRRLKTVSPQTRVILISAYPDREFRKLGLQAGAVAFLDKKDIDTATVKQLVEDAFGSRALR